MQIAFHHFTSNWLSNWVLNVLYDRHSTLFVYNSSCINQLNVTFRLIARKCVCIKNIHSTVWTSCYLTCLFNPDNLSHYWNIAQCLLPVENWLWSDERRNYEGGKNREVSMHEAILWLLWGKWFKIKVNQLLNKYSDLILSSLRSYVCLD